MKLKTTLMSIAIGTSILASGQQPVYLDKTKPIEERVEDALSRMTLEEKVRLCHAQSKFSSAGVPRLGIPEIRMSDGPHGVRAEINWNDWGYSNWTNDSITAFPALTALAATWNPEMSAIYGKSIGEEARYRDKNVMLGPGVNIYRTPLNGRNFEYMGEDPYLSGEMVVPYIQELQKNGVAACVKHFAFNNQERWRGSINVVLSDRALYEIYLPAFKKAVVDGCAWSIMGAYNQVWDEHCCHNSRLLNDILRGEWGFDGAVITDWGGAHDTKQAALNGLDIEMGTWTNGLTSESKSPYSDYYLANPYLDMMRSGEVPESTVDDKARNILRLIFRTAMNPDRPFGSATSPEHYAAAKSIGDEAIVLLKNNGILPLDPAKYKKILVVGENAVRFLNEGGGSSELKVKDMFTPLDAIRNTYGNGVTYAEGYRSGRAMYEREDRIAQTTLDSLRNQAVAMAKDADAVIYIGGLNKNAFQDCESTDRREYNLPWGQDKIIEELVAVNPNVIVANVTGNAYAMPWLDKVPAVIQSWYLGTMIGPSMADVISGKTNPSGKLPFSFPKRLEDNGAHSFGAESYPGIEREGKSPQQQYLEDILVGYRWHDTKKIPAMFPFGHGLSYTTFEYDKASLSSNLMEGDKSITVSVPVTNIGKVAGKEVVQLYIADEKSSLPRPLKELKGFKKVELNPSQTEVVKFEITPDDLKFFDDKAHEWIAEPGKFKVYIGSSSTDIKSTLQFSYK
ncbi:MULTISPECIES: glycoside hydrolase family 3 C-terminal domain-containing protein [Muribaculum]|uniref:glycoside hydrolase family 3 C-terminal domain-containing protein n=4 Tax=Muribaculaceae TaxID=2005473 RepID=UPI00248D17FC|nr:MULTISPECIES: glycoside hydrolase family 3 C-terminal domain-containing protein [Muribaculum]MCX4276463.1 glycoside hydrolase family 3 C-terminal domain-containing protein [Muribaculum sp.]